MSVLSQNLLVLAVAVVLGLAIFLGLRQKQGRDELKLQQLATDHGWQFERVRQPLAWGERYSTAQWRLEAMSTSAEVESGPGSSNIAMSTRWSSDRPGSPLLIGPRLGTASAGAMGEVLLQLTVQAALGAESSGVHEVAVDDGEFSRRYLVLARHDAEAAELLTPALREALLSATATRPLIKRTVQGLTVEVVGVHIKDGEELRRLVHLGETLLALLPQMAKHQ